MDKETAKNLFNAGAIFLFLDVPQNMEFGIDYNSWRTGPNFKGVKMIPPGIHFIYFNVTDKHGSVGLRNGFFHNFKQKEILVKKWNPQTEAIDNDHKFSSSELENFEINKQELDRFLGPYPYEEYKRWVSLTNKLNQNFIEKLLPENGIVTSGSELVGEQFTSSKKNLNKEADVKDRLTAPMSLSEAEKRLPTMAHSPGTNIRFTKIPSFLKSNYSQPGEVTQHSIDMSSRLETLIQDSDRDELNVLCELQLAFVCFLIGQVYDAFEQWKSLVSLLCNCDRAVVRRASFFTEFLSVLYFQLKEMPEDFFIDIISKDNFLTVNLHNLFDNINDATQASDSVLSKLKEKSEKFKNYLSQRFAIDFEQEPDEYAPVVCGEV